MATAAAARPRAIEQSLDTHQEEQGGKSACSVIALYWSLYLLHHQYVYRYQDNTPPLSRVQVLRYMRQACAEWSHEKLKSQMHTQEVLKHFPAFASYVRIEAEHQGRMLRSNGTQVWVIDLHQDWVITPLVDVLEKLASFVMMERRARSCVFSRQGHTMVVGMTPELSGQRVRYDLLDGLGQCIFDCQKLRRAGSWIQCYSSADAVHYLERYYPLYDDVKTPIADTPASVRLENADMDFCFFLVVLSLAPQPTPLERSAY